MDLIFDFFSSKLWKRLLVFYLPSDSQKIVTEILKRSQCLNHVLKAFFFVCVWAGVQGIPLQQSFETKFETNHDS